MNWFDRQIVQFVLQWAPFGGPPKDDVLPRFGLSPEQLGIRFRAIVSTWSAHVSTLTVSERELLTEIPGRPARLGTVDA